jgi:Family of unknown function (DUF6152)
VAAHHGAAAFENDPAKRLVLKGVVTQWIWANPHTVGRWVDNYTFAADSIDFDDRTWLDNAGRPHSDAMKVHEQYKRTDRDHQKMTIVIDDPKFYTKPWTALILSQRLQSPKFDIREMECSPSETALYNKLFANPAAGIEP